MGDIVPGNDNRTVGVNYKIQSNILNNDSSIFPKSQSPIPIQPPSQTQFTHVLSFDQDKMLVTNEVPIEVQRAYVAAREQIQELSVNFKYLN